MNHVLARGLLAAALALSASAAFAQDAAQLPADIPEKAKACTQCHGPTGLESLAPTYPKLAGQYPDYLAKALHDYRSGERQNPQMQPFAQNLSDADIEEIAAYFSRQATDLTDLSHVR
ncbi:c-type cytochrome [Coralloluteibacterium stylophorae]|uniref:Cytochrome c n=1 Tax=Coralloluteibacterium stylophorae TaxID=1776034 RepID=A0A8J8AZ78_9GAMM|nr:cytochrome c [Coralloluteibacterium stylophorae]MBS7455991.1 cytochrome c [Coralloluteibacterium stylophorae]